MDDWLSQLYFGDGFDPGGNFDIPSGGAGPAGFSNFDFSGEGGGRGPIPESGSTFSGFDNEDSGGLFQRGGYGYQAIPGLMALLQGYKAKKTAREPTLSDAEKAAIISQGTNARTRALSRTVGNPALNPGAEMEIQNYATNALAGMDYEDKKRRRLEEALANRGMYLGGGVLAQALLAALTQGNQ